MQPYPAEIEQRMQRFYQSLSEKDRRRYAAVEALKLEWSGKGYISQLLGCDDEAMQLDRAELDELESLNMKRIRRIGGGRKLAIETIEGIDAAFLKVIREHTAGSPMDEMVKWTNLTAKESHYRMGKCQCRKARIQRNHIGCALLVWVRLKALAIANKTNVYQLKQALLDNYFIQQLKNPSLEMILA